MRYLVAILIFCIVLGDTVGPTAAITAGILFLAVGVIAWAVDVILNLVRRPR